MDENLINGFSPVSLPVTTGELARELMSVIDELTDEGVNIIPAKSIEILSSDNTLQVGQAITLKVETSPTNANSPTLVWETSNPEVAIVDNNGVVIAKKVGEVDIMATSPENNKITSKISITITKTGEAEEVSEKVLLSEDSKAILTEDGKNIKAEK